MAELYISIYHKIIETTVVKSWQFNSPLLELKIVQIFDRLLECGAICKQNRGRRFCCRPATASTPQTEVHTHSSHSFQCTVQCLKMCVSDVFEVWPSGQTNNIIVVFYRHTFPTDTMIIFALSNLSSLWFRTSVVCSLSLGIVCLCAQLVK